MKSLLFAVSAVVLLAATGCSAENDSADVPASDTAEGALAESGLAAGVYFLDGAPPRKDAILGLRVPGGGAKGTLLYSYPGDPSRIEVSCLVKIKVVGSANAKRLELTCPADAQPQVYALESREDDKLELKNPQGESFTLAKVDPDFFGNPRLECEGRDLDARIDLVPGTKRRALVQTKEKRSGGREDVFWLEGTSKLEGLDLSDNDWDLTLPSSLEDDLPITFGFVNNTTPFERWREQIAMTCKVRR